jgi:alpha-beta hydrolase superfamily lysophospholipase
MSSTILAPFTARDGENLALYEWPLDAWFNDFGAAIPPPRAVVLLVHGLGEHAGRYDALANRLFDWGFAVRAYDQRGHGQSGGARGVLPGRDTLLQDLAEIVDDTRQRCLRLTQPVDGVPGRQQPLPLILLGHSLGGLLVSRFEALKIRPIDGLVLTSPALATELSLLQKIMIAVLLRLAPDFCVGNRLDPAYLSHDPQVVRNYRADRLVHDRISARLARFITIAGVDTIAAAALWQTPTLLMYAGADRLVKPQGSRAFLDAAAGSPGVRAGTVTSKCFDGFYHELFNEKNPEPVYEALQAWLDARFA